MVAFTTATNCYSEQKLREEKHQPLSAKVWNSGITSVDSLANIIMHGLKLFTSHKYTRCFIFHYVCFWVPFRLGRDFK